MLNIHLPPSLQDPMVTAIGSTIYKMNIHDPDIGHNAQLEYDIVNGTIDIPFDVTRTTGEIRLAAPVDYERNTVFHVSLIYCINCRH